MKSTINPNYILEVQLINVSYLKKIIFNIKNIFENCNIVFDTSDDGGLKITNMAADETIIVDAYLNNKSFNFFRCTYPILIISVDLFFFSKYLNMMPDDDPILIYIVHDDPSVLYIKSINNSNSSTSTFFGMKILDTINDDIIVPTFVTTNVTPIQSKIFYDIVKQLTTYVSSYVDIILIKNRIDFKCECTLNSGHIVKSYIGPNNITHERSAIVKNKYNLKNIYNVSKFENLCSDMNIYLNNDCPLIVEVLLDDIGHVHIYVAPYIE